MVLLFVGLLYVGVVLWVHCSTFCAHFVGDPPTPHYPHPPGVPMAALCLPYAYPPMGFAVLYMFSIRLIFWSGPIHFCLLT